MPGFGYSTGGGTGTIFTPGGTVGSRFTNASGATRYITTVDLLRIWSFGLANKTLLGLFRDNHGVAGELITQSSLPTLSAGTNTYTLPRVVVVEDGESIWGYVSTESGGRSLPFDGGVLMTNGARHSGEVVVGSYHDTIAMGPSVGYIMPLYFNGDGTPPPSSFEARVDLGMLEPLTEGTPETRVNLALLEPLTEGTPKTRITLFLLECLHPVLPELPMSTEPFPGFGNSSINPALPQALDPFDSPLPGLSFEVHKKPLFNTKISESPAGNEIRNSLSQYPRWEFTLPYEFLEDSSGAESSLKTIMGFFLERQGSFDSWLFKDPDDYLVVNGFCGTSDNTITQFPFCRTIGNFHEKVGQVDTTNTITLYLSVEEDQAIPATPGPYTITVDEAASFIEDLGVTKGGMAMTKVTGAPAAGEYSVNIGTGVYTFNAIDESDAVVISYRYEIDPAAYTVTMPNLVVFDSAPPVGTLSADFQFYFACRFLEDMMDFEKFMDKLWALQECNFKSIIQ